MPLENKALDSLQISDIDSLVENKVAEKKTIDYKAALVVNTESQRKEFLADVSSFANASGGHLIYGVRETKGVPTEICGIDIENPDQEILRLDSIARDGIEPRMPGLAMRAIPSKTRQVLVIRVPKSWASPHMVTFQHHSRFYSRSSNGKYPLDVGEIRAAFLASGALAERIRGFRIERLAAIVARETPVPLGDGAKLVLHIVPIRAFDSASMLSTSSLEAQMQHLPPIARAADGSRYNLDGFVTFDRGSTGSPADSYIQLFRNGCIEAVDMYLLRQRSAGQHTIPSMAFEEYLLKALRGYLVAQKSLGIEPPLFVMLSLLHVKGYEMGVDPSKFFLSEHSLPVDRENLILPEIVVDEYGVEPATLLRPAFDAVWNACGWPQSINYDKSGKWVGH
ncbi:MAG: ATP-binding protein [Chloroflexi bacterium]|nr:ATP-binding protein [Chloroflexota bacterium]